MQIDPMRILAIIICLFSFDLIKSQSIELSDFRIQKSYEKNCDSIKRCIDSVRLMDNSLFINLYIKDPLSYKPERTLSYKIIEDTLFISYYSNPIEKDTLVFNEETKEYDTLKSIAQSIWFSDMLHKECKVFLFEFKGINKVPKCFVYNQEVVPSCPITYLSFSIYQGDTINIINKNGYKDGKWLRFFDSGEIEEKKLYDDGRFLGGPTFDRNGNDLHIIGEFSDGIFIIQSDTLQNK
jgi:hypothetical protein